jgi:hypothetical protein
MRKAWGEPRPTTQSVSAPPPKAAATTSDPWRRNTPHTRTRTPWIAKHPGWLTRSQMKESSLL